MRLNNLIRREFLRILIGSAIGLETIGNLTQESFAENTGGNQTNRPNNIIDYSQFPKTHVYYTNPTIPQNQKPKLADKNSLLPATPAYRRIVKEKYGINDGEYWVLVEREQKEILDGFEKVGIKEGISFVGDRDYFKILWESRAENMGFSPQEKEHYWEEILSKSDITSLMYSFLESQPIEEEV